VSVRDALLIGGLAFVLRTAFVLVWGRTASGPNDTLFYEIAAGQLANGDGFSTLTGAPTAHWPPGFPFLISLGYRAFGIHLKLVFVLNVVLATATAVLLYVVATHMLGRAAGRFAGTAFALLPGPIFFTGLFLSETTFIFLLVGVLALALLLPERSWTPVVLGVALALTALTRGEGLLMPVIPLAMWWGHVDRRTWIRRALLLLGTMAVCIAPWTIRNAIVMDSFIPVATNPSTTLWSGHNPDANGGPTYAPPELLARIPTGLSSPEHEVAEAHLLRTEAIHWAVRNPRKELGLIPRRLLALNTGDRLALTTWSNAPGAREVRTSGLIVLSVLGDAGGYAVLFVALASLVLLGPRRLWRLHPGMQAVLAYLVVSLFAYGVVYYGQFRYRVPLEPLMLLVGAPLAAAVWSQRARLRRAAP
jgi:4-amino-4-deoxy-L-arabinose transferase-like glycosyltransferase